MPLPLHGGQEKLFLGGEKRHNPRWYGTDQQLGRREIRSQRLREGVRFAPKARRPVAQGDRPKIKLTLHGKREVCFGSVRFILVRGRKDPIGDGGRGKRRGIMWTS